MQKIKWVGAASLPIRKRDEYIRGLSKSKSGIRALGSGVEIHASDFASWQPVADRSESKRYGESWSSANLNWKTKTSKLKIKVRLRDHGKRSQNKKWNTKIIISTYPKC